MFIIKYRNRSKSLIVKQMLSTFNSFRAASLQADFLKKVFPFNTYYIEEKK